MRFQLSRLRAISKKIVDLELALIAIYLSFVPHDLRQWRML
jgi:hypothetical protein